jgi:hypothetical protein
MPSSPFPPDMLPSLEHNGIAITVINHHGFSRPDRGPMHLLVAFFMVRVMRIMSAIGAQAWEKSIN